MLVCQREFITSFTASGRTLAGEFLARHPLVDAITFTGETRTGEAIMKAASAGMRDISSELGGKKRRLSLPIAISIKQARRYSPLVLHQLRPDLSVY